MTSCWSVQEALTYVIATIYFWKISKQWFWYCSIGYIWQLISLICLYWMPESPRYLLKSGKFEQAREAFNRIAKMNKRAINWDDIHLKSSEMSNLPTFGVDIETLEIDGFPVDAS